MSLAKSVSPRYFPWSRHCSSTARYRGQSAAVNLTMYVQSVEEDGTDSKTKGATSKPI
jgi:hypothetical protein